MGIIKDKFRLSYLIAAASAILQLLVFPNLSEETVVVISTILCAVLIFSTWRVKKNFPLPAKIVTTGSLLFFTYFPILLSHKMWIVFFVSWFAALFVILQILQHAVYKRKMDKDIFLAQFLYLICWLMATSNYVYVDGLLTPFWKISIALALVVGVFQTVKTGQMEQDIKKDIVVRSFVFLACGCLTFLLVSIGIQNMNYALDTSEPTQYSAVIEDKIIRGGRKGGNKYYFQFTVNDETFNMKVFFSAYKSHNEGDTYNITYHEGAFGVPYYMAGKN